MSRLRERLGGSGRPLIALSAIVTLEEFGNGAFGVLGPEISKSLRVSATGFGFVFLFTTLALLASPVVIGYLADRSSRTRIVLFGLGVWAIGTVATGAIAVMWLLVLARMVASIGFAASGPTHDSLISDYYPLSGRGPAFAVHRGARNAGSTLGALAAGTLASAVGWRWIFVALGLASLVPVASALRIPEPLRGQHDVVARAGAHISRRLRPLGMWRSFKMLFQIKSWKRYAYAFVFLGMAFFAVIPMSGFFYDAVFGIGSFGRGAIFAALSVAHFAGILTGAWIGERRVADDPRRLGSIVAASLLATAVGWTLHGFAATVPAAVALLMLTGFVMAIPTVPFAMIVSATAPAHIRGQAFGAITVFAALGALFIPIGLAVGDWIGFRATYVVFSQGFLLAALIAHSASALIERDIERAETIGIAEAEIDERRTRGEEIDLVRVIDVDVSYGTVQVLFGVGFSVMEGEMIALLGTNGAGKSTLLKTISGLVKPSGGVVLFDGQDITGMDAEATTERGIVQVPGGRGVFPGLSVDKNLRLGAFRSRRDPQAVAESMDRALEHFPALRKRLENEAGTLSGGEQQMLTLAQGLMADPRLLMIDELSLGLAPVVVRDLLAVVRRIHASGVTVILVEQSVNVALTLAERAVFMDKGTVLYSGPAEELLDRRDIVRSVFLAEARAAFTEDH